MLSVLSNKADDIPIVIDTGASMLVTHCKDDFIDEIQPTCVGDLQELSGLTECQGQGLASGQCAMSLVQ